ncbi:conserved Plasmodium protein, unknown function [Plasmodium berghei]|uniref:Uncharacterized protein n=2 Tax=Plasmodium berghei TaxID=5821 RepID=A0A509AIH0_PLABA|nr:conserved Plasmodium protein, unknown function [Plasmodium berghei ANKA]CXI31623.1 conserved Plasmodium protein, unknown function [Plasmodium berghei]SCM21017.1 conserved Plasmodium protein, unknown function [Plasmodium berghei]SCN24414.1 conserved Plasmodium protein, unknown function [Plasmodium berghei]SCO59607.1 conserved Plasmodium protein, unknown function [Plasmodium berghei]SCO60799.1 conserved Plasmodium protein, unknown function [Plasmodium berghei]|eukprot:XP_034421102.1 conserved Plasmodium protein, unknown function [Plasmodium berghei ANKA]
MITEEYEDRIQVTSSCWLSKYKGNNNNIKSKNISKPNNLVIPNFNVCLESLALPIIKSKNDLECINENKQLNRLRRERKKKKIDDTNIINDDDVCSILLRSKALNETWNNMNKYLNCYIYNYVNNIIDKEIIFLNKHLCLKNDKVSLLIIKTQMCPFVNLMQYRILVEHLKKINSPDEDKEKDDTIYMGNERTIPDKENNICDDNNNGSSYPYSINDKMLTPVYTILTKKKNIMACIINVYHNDTVENIIIRIIKRINSSINNKRIQIDKNNVDELFHKVIKRQHKNGVLVIFIKNYLKLKSSTFSAFLLYLTHLKEINNINISVIITNCCILSGLRNLDNIITKHLHVNIYNMYINYYNLMENIMFNPIFNNALFKLKDYNTLIDYIFFCNHSISFLKLKYIIYMYIREFFDKKLLSFLNIPLEYFNEKDINEENNQECVTKRGSERHDNKNEKQLEYTKKTFSIYKGELIKSLSCIDVKNIHKKYALLLHASNFYKIHINYFKNMGKSNILYIIDMEKKRKIANQEKMIMLSNKSIPISKQFHEKIDKNKDTFQNKRHNDFLQDNINAFKKGNKENNTLGKYDMNIQNSLENEKNEKNSSNEHNNIKKCNNKRIERNGILKYEDDTNLINGHMNKKSKIKHESFHICIENFSFIYNEKESNDAKNMKNVIVQKIEGNEINESTEFVKAINKIDRYNTTDNMNEIDNSDNNEITFLPNVNGLNKGKDISYSFLLNRDLIKHKLKNNGIFQSYYYQNYSMHNLSENLSPINRNQNNDFMNNCDYIKQYVINNLFNHMKSEHNIDGFQILQKEWENNEYLKIYKYEENIVSKAETCNTDVNDKISKNKGNKNIKKSNDGEKYIYTKEDNENEKKMELLYLHKCLVKSICIRMIELIYKKTKYNICLSIINIILKNIPIYTSLRKRVKFIKDLFKKYERRYIIQNLENLKTASDEIDKEIKQILNTICDLFINLYVTKKNIIKKIINDIFSFLKDTSYIFRLEEYINSYRENKTNSSPSLSMPFFLNKIYFLIIFLNVSIVVKKKNEYNKRFSGYENSNNKFTPNENDYNNQSELNRTPKKEMFKEVINSHISWHQTSVGGTNKKIPYTDLSPININIDYENITEMGKNKDTNNNISKNNGNNFDGIMDNNEKIDIIIENYLSNMNTEDIDTTCIEFILVFFCEYLYFLLIPCVYLLPLANLCITHEHSVEFYDTFKPNLQMKLLNVLYYNKLELKDINSVNFDFSLSYKSVGSVKNLRNWNEKMSKQSPILDKSRRRDYLEVQDNKMISKENPKNRKLDDMNDEIKYFSFEHIGKICEIEDLVIIFKIIQGMNMKYMNISNMFVEYINVKLYIDTHEISEKNINNIGRDTRSGTNKNNNGSKLSSYCYSKTFQELFYKFMIGIMSLFYFLKIIHIPSIFLRDNETSFDSTSFISYDNQNNQNIYDDHNNQYSTNNEFALKEHISKNAQFNEQDQQEIGDDKNVLANDKNGQFSTLIETNNDPGYRYKNYVFNMLSNINLRKLVYGNSYYIN